MKAARRAFTSPKHACNERIDKSENAGRSSAKRVWEGNRRGRENGREAVPVQPTTGAARDA